MSKTNYIDLELPNNITQRVNAKNRRRPRQPKHFQRKAVARTIETRTRNF